MRTRTVAGLVMAGFLALAQTGCFCSPGTGDEGANGEGGPMPEVTNGENGTPPPPPPPPPPDGAKPQLDVGTFGIFQLVPPSPVLPYPTAWAWVPMDPRYKAHELWILFKVGKKTPQGNPIGFLKPGAPYPDTELQLVYEGKWDPPGTHTDDGIHQDDYDAFKAWVIQQYATRFGLPGVDPMQDLELYHHTATVH